MKTEDVLASPHADAIAIDMLRRGDLIGAAKRVLANSDAYKRWELFAIVGRWACGEAVPMGRELNALAGIGEPVVGTHEASRRPRPKLEVVG